MSSRVAGELRRRRRRWVDTTGYTLKSPWVTDRNNVRAVAGGASALSIFVAALLLSTACTRPSPQDPGAPSAVRTDAEAVTEPSRASQQVAAIDVIPGELTVRVFAHSLATVEGDIACWSYVSDGLLRQGQREVIFTVKREDREAVETFPTDVLDFYRMLYQLASKGQRVTAGERTNLAPGSGPLFGSTRWRGILYTHPVVMEGVPVDRPALAGIVVSAEEIALAERVGPSRVLALLGSVSTFFPTAPWLDRARADVATAQDAELSILAVSPRLWIPGALVEQRSAPLPSAGARAPGDAQLVQPKKERVVLTLPRKLPVFAQQALANAARGEALALMTSPQPTAESILVWRPGQSGAHAISTPTADGTRIAGNFLLLLPGHAENDVQIIEDGFAVKLTQDSWPRVLAAIAGEEAFSLGDREARTVFEIMWTTPVLPAGETSGPVVKQHIILQTESKLLDERTTPEALAEYILKIDAALVEVVPSTSSTPVELQVICKLAHDREPLVRVVARPSLAPELATTIERKLATIPSPPISNESIEFSIVYRLWGGQSE